jgi:hypothetical protein
MDIPDFLEAKSEWVITPFDVSLDRGVEILPAKLV